MAGYTRQEVYADTDVIEASHTNNEFDQVVAAFNSSTGHKHDGTAAEGPLIGLISDATQTDKVEIVTGGAKTTGTHQTTGLVTADVGVTATTGNITATAGDVVLTVGDVTLAALATVDGRDISVDGTKLDGIETGATADQIASEVTSTPAGDLIATDVQAALNELDIEKAALAGAAFTGAITTTSTFDGRDVSTDGAKLDGIEAGATADQIGAEIKTAYQAEANAFTDAQFTKLAGIETAATADQIATEVPNTPAGNIVATNVQTAINELDTEKAALVGATFTGPVSCTTFTSTGIDDNATAERFQISDTTIVVGPNTAASSYAIHRFVNDGDVRISGGLAGNTGANMVLFGGAHATLANDILLRAGGLNQLQYDDSASSWDFQSNDVLAPNLLTGKFKSSDQVITSAGLLTLAHGLGAEPELLQISLKAVNAVLGYSVGEETPANPSIGNGRGPAITKDGTDVKIRFDADTGAFSVAHNTTGATTVITNTDWNLVVRAWV
jgi:hypothetical protein